MAVVERFIACTAAEDAIDQPFRPGPAVDCRRFMFWSAWTSTATNVAKETSALTPYRPASAFLRQHDSLLGS